jgi:hypothetical protein
MLTSNQVTNKASSLSLKGTLLAYIAVYNYFCFSSAPPNVIFAPNGVDENYFTPITSRILALLVFSF